MCCTLRILFTARAGRPNLVHRHRRHTGALYNAADTRLAALPSCGHLFGSAPLTRGQAAEAVSWLHRQAHELLTFWPPASASAAVTAVTSHNHLTYPFLTAFLSHRWFDTAEFVDRLLVQADAPLHPTLTDMTDALGSLGTLAAAVYKKV